MAKKQTDKVKPVVVNLRQHIADKVKIVNMPKELKRMLALMGGNTSAFKSLMLDSIRENEYNRVTNKNRGPKDSDKD